MNYIHSLLKVIHYVLKNRRRRATSCTFKRAVNDEYIGMLLLIEIGRSVVKMVKFALHGK